MRARGVKASVFCLLVAIFCRPVWGADLNIRGNVKILGSNAQEPGNLEVTGSLRVSHIASFDKTTAVHGSLFAFGGLVINKNFETFTLTPQNPEQHLDAWDLCFFSGFSGTIIRCEVTPDESDGAKNNWTFLAVFPNFTTQAACFATCMNFAPVADGN